MNEGYVVVEWGVQPPGVVKDCPHRGEYGCVVARMKVLDSTIPGVWPGDVWTVHTRAHVEEYAAHWEKAAADGTSVSATSPPYGGDPPRFVESQWDYWINSNKENAKRGWGYMHGLERVRHGSTLRSRPRRSIRARRRQLAREV